MAESGPPGPGPNASARKQWNSDVPIKSLNPVSARPPQTKFEKKKTYIVRKLLRKNIKARVSKMAEERLTQVESFRGCAN